MDNPIAQKISLTYAKRGRARFHSHHDLMRFFARAIRRAALPLRYSAGFNPHPRLVFPHALGLGIESACEIVEIEFTASFPVEELRTRLTDVLFPVLDVLDVTLLPCKKHGQRVQKTEYCIRGWQSPDRLREAVEQFVAAPEVLVERGVGKKRREVNARQYVDDACVQDEILRLVLRHTDKGAGRPDEICRWLAHRTGEDERDLCIQKSLMEVARPA